MLYRYFNGKKRAEEGVKSNFGDNGYILRPGFIYGTRYVDGYSIPLWPFGKYVITIRIRILLYILYTLYGLWTLYIHIIILYRPLDFFLGLPLLSQLKHLPGMRALLARPIDVNALGKVAAFLALSPTEDIKMVQPGNVLSEEDMHTLSNKI